MAIRAETYGTSSEDMTQYFHDIDQYPLLTKEREIELAQTIEAGKEIEAKAVVNGIALALGGYMVFDISEDLQKVHEGEEAKCEFWTSNLRLVVDAAKKYQNRSVLLPDLIQEGNMELGDAIDKFDWRKGYKFSTHARLPLKRAMTRALASQGRGLKLPPDVYNDVARTEATRRSLYQKTGQEPTLSMLAEELKFPEEKVTNILAIPSQPESLDYILPARNTYEGGTGAPIGDYVLVDPITSAAVDRLIKSQAITEAVEELIASLPERDQKVLRSFLGMEDGQPRPATRVSREHDIKLQMVKRIIDRSPGRMRRTAVSKGIDGRSILENR